MFRRLRGAGPVLTRSGTLRPLAHWLALAFVLSSSCSSSRKEVDTTSAHFVHDAYVWQTPWSGATVAALQEAQPYIHGWRVLAGEVGLHSSLSPVVVDVSALRRTGKPVVLVVRIDGRYGGQILSTSLLQAIPQMLKRWQASDLALQALEIDYDCPVPSLPRYLAFLRELRKRIKQEMRLSITALPSWIGNAVLHDLLATTDEALLQVHSISDSKQGAFNADRACRLARAWSTETNRPFRVVLPAYWSRIPSDENRRADVVESKTSRHGRRTGSLEVFIKPSEVQTVVEQLRKLQLPNLQGLVWFRLPTKTDRTAWSFTTWRAILLQESISQGTRVIVRLQGDGSGTRNAYLMNVGEIDSDLPQQITVTAQGCSLVESFFPYEAKKTPDGFRWIRNGSNMLKAGTERLVGWARCSGKDWQSHLDF